MYITFGEYCLVALREERAQRQIDRWHFTKHKLPDTLNPFISHLIIIFYTGLCIQTQMNFNFQKRPDTRLPVILMSRALSTFLKASNPLKTPQR